MERVRPSAIITQCVRKSQRLPRSRSSGAPARAASPARHGFVAGPPGDALRGRPPRTGNSSAADRSQDREARTGSSPRISSGPPAAATAPRSGGRRPLGQADPFGGPPGSMVERRTGRSFSTGDAVEADHGAAPHRLRDPIGGISCSTDFIAGSPFGGCGADARQPPFEAPDGGPRLAARQAQPARPGRPMEGDRGAGRQGRAGGVGTRARGADPVARRADRLAGADLRRARPGGARPSGSRGRREAMPRVKPPSPCRLGPGARLQLGRVVLV